MRRPHKKGRNLNTMEGVSSVWPAWSLSTNSKNFHWAWLSTKLRAAVCAGTVVGAGTWHHLPHSKTERQWCLGKIQFLALAALAKGGNMGKAGRCRETKKVPLSSWSPCSCFWSGFSCGKLVSGDLPRFCQGKPAWPGTAASGQGPQLIHSRLWVPTLIDWGKTHSTFRSSIA